MKHKLLTPLITLLAALALGACAHSPDPIAATSKQKQALTDLELNYNAGNYAKVAQAVGLSVELQSAPPGVQIPALKLQAFSYCLQDNTVQCRRSFDKLLQRHPDFDLAPSERDHPMWGPVFTQAKADADTNSAMPSSK
ncbi:TssQ family T6SS-associated lipoprotein [Alcaligenaceae bacterium]|nr:TssQ family T6SS-associated lipoprotein [Alcaligenaceae bacterium]